MTDVMAVQPTGLWHAVLQSVCGLVVCGVQAERQRAELQRELAALGDHVDEANENARSQVAGFCC